MLWLVVAWLAWLVAFASPIWSLGNPPYNYLAICCSACPAVAVLGARRPGVAAWNFVVAALLALLLMPLVEQRWDAANWQLDGPRAILVSVILLVGVGNYIRTRYAVPVLLAAATLGWNVLRLVRMEAPDWTHALSVFLPGLLAVSVWITASQLHPPRDALAALWLAFRDGYGFLWARRVQDQFNAAVKNAGGSESLTWRGVEPALKPGSLRQLELQALLQVTLKRFGVQMSGKWE
jgi:hypothetical protein